MAFFEMPSLAAYGFDRGLLSQLAVAAVVGGHSAEQKIKALSFLELFGPADVHRKLCLEQGLCLVEIGVQDWKASQGQSRESLYDFVSNRPQFENQLWEALVFGGQYTLDVAVEIANDQGLLADSLFRFLSVRPHLGVLALHSMQCRRFSESAAAYGAEAELEDVVLDRKRSLASLGFLASKIETGVADNDAPGARAEMELRVCRAAAAVDARGVALTRSSVLQFCLKKLELSNVDAHVYAAAGLELCLESDPEMLQIIRLAYHKDPWKEKLGYASAETLRDQTEWIATTALGKLFLSTTPSMMLFRAALPEEPQELLSLVVSCLGPNRF